MTEGEQWLLPLLATIDAKFPLLDMIERFPPDIVDDVEDDLRGYAAAQNPEIKVEKLAHFMMGVFWKAAVHSWRGDSKEPAIGLGPYV